MNSKVAIVLAVILGVIAALAVRSYLDSEVEKEKARYRTIQIVIANKDIKEGEPLSVGVGQNGMIAYREFPESMIKSGMITPAEARRYRGYISLRRVESGAPLFRQDLKAPIEHSDSAESVVAEGMRAVTIPVDMISGVAGLIRTGDRVDVIATFNQTNQANQRTVATSYLLQNVRVIALDNKTQYSTRKEDRINRPYRVVTFELQPGDALRLINAQEQGTIRLILRNRSDVEIKAKERNGKPIVTDVLTNELGVTVPHSGQGGGGR